MREWRLHILQENVFFIEDDIEDQTSEKILLFMSPIVITVGKGFFVGVSKNILAVLSLPEMNSQVSMSGPIQMSSNEGSNLFPMEDNSEIVKTHANIKKTIFQNDWVNFNKTWQMASFSKRDSILWKFDSCPLPREDSGNISPIFFVRTVWPISTKFGRQHP